MKMSRKVYDITSSDNIESLDSEVDIEELLPSILDINNEIKFLAELKKKRAKTIDDRVNFLKEIKEKLEKVIHLTLSENKTKSLNFPGLATVSRRSKKGKWVVLDEDCLISELQKLSTDEDGVLSKSELSDVLVSKITFTNKKTLDSVLESLCEQGKKVEFASKTDDSESLVVKEDKDREESDSDLDREDSSAEDYDSLEI